MSTGTPGGPHHQPLRLTRCCGWGARGINAKTPCAFDASWGLPQVLSLDFQTATTTSTFYTTTNNTTSWPPSSSPFASLPWTTLVAAYPNPNLTSTPGSETAFAQPRHQSLPPPLEQPERCGSPPEGATWTALIGSHSDASACGGGGDTPVLLTPMSPLRSISLDLLVSPSGWLVSLDGAHAHASSGVGDALSPSLETLIQQLQNDGQHSNTATGAPPKPLGTKLLLVGMRSTTTTTTTTTSSASVLKCSKKPRRNKHDPRGPTWHPLDDRLQNMFSPQQLHLPSDDFRALLAAMALSVDEDKRVKQLRRRNKCVEYSRENRRKNRLKRAKGTTAGTNGTAGATACAAVPTKVPCFLTAENQHLQEQLAVLQQRIASIEHNSVPTE